jgi:FkbM family methyltransferase
MFLVSPILTRLAALAGPRARHDLHLHRMMRWGKGEAEWLILDRLVDPARAAIDVGANDGVYAGRLSQLCHKVHAFEPIPWLAVTLARKLRPNVEVHQMALSNREGEAELRIPIEDNCFTTIDSNNNLPPAFHVRVVPCRIARLDDVISEPVGFIKIDVEGHELSVLQGALETIRKNRPTLIVESVRSQNPASPEAAIELLRQEGYSAFFLRDGASYPVGSTPPQDVVNYIFCHGRNLSL